MDFSVDASNNVVFTYSGGDDGRYVHMYVNIILFICDQILEN